MKGIADTGFLVPFANRNDAHPEWTLQIAERLTEPLLTCEAEREAIPLVCPPES